MIKNIINKSKKIVLGISTLSITNLFRYTPTVDTGVVGTSLGIQTRNVNVIKNILDNSPIVSVLVQRGILFGILFSLYKIAHDLLTGQGEGGKSLWKYLGAMIAFAVLYFYLFSLGGNTFQGTNLNTPIDY